MFSRTGLPSRIQEEIHIFNMSLLTENHPANLPSSTKENQQHDEYEPALSELLSTVECLVCRSIPAPPIYNCENGHFICISCRPRLPSLNCAYCSARFTEMRNYPLENLVLAKILTCDFSKDGCAAKGMVMIEYEDHVKKCSYRKRKQQTEQPFKIPCEPCRVLTEKNLNDTVVSNQPCPRCKSMNSTRKIKCHSCHLNLRVQTPMCGRHLLGSN